MPCGCHASFGIWGGVLCVYVTMTCDQVRAVDLCSVQLEYVPTCC